jgi:hypothetical protein
LQRGGCRPAYRGGETVKMKTATATASHKTPAEGEVKLCLTQAGGGLSRAADGNGGMGQAAHVSHMAVYMSDADALHEDVEDRA